MRIAASVAALLALSLPLAEGAGAATKKAAKPAAAAEARHASLTALAANGDMEAQYQLALAYRDGGHGLKPDARTALVWFTLAGAGGHAAAAVEAAKAFETGKGVTRDLNAAGNWWYKAGTLGDAHARKRWVELFVDGEVHAIGSHDGISWLADAAEGGDLRAMMGLADVLERGHGAPPDPDQAEALYRRAALLKGDLEARFRLGRLLLSLPAQWRNPADEEWNLKDAERKSLPFGAVWYPVKPPNAEEGKAVQLRPGINEGERWLRSAAAKGHVEAQYLLGSAKVKGMELPMDMVEGVAWLEAAAVQGHAEALLALGDLAAKGQGFYVKDPVRAYVMYELAAAQGEESAKAARDAIAKAMNPRQSGRARQLVQELRDLSGL
ncbi:Tetratricopeptide Repeat Family Protein [Paramagnetospirillum magnetotacticum MS-1]|uniref:Tetratricopeptide Repeat Family Protein n=1 Tax=Paramagnetospirillum magnetotacticum MS-1 TaxID=272627 RepID=A0A0C2YC68_PARME|nr:tetratricopeptide repeat protein [Paramagnetospirillum magnetotacticum]KIL97344.1 Tetratricopeptide Repeat Family Protein [Paramagnetospirillum magnetotacticum MS-1]